MNAGESIAVIGMAGRFPKAGDLDEYWANLVAGRDCLDDLGEGELRANGVPEGVLRNPDYVRRAASLAGFAEFDAEFFGFAPGMAAALDPQQRLFLESCWHALEDAAYLPSVVDGAIGVFGAGSFTGYLQHTLLSQRDPRQFLDTGTSTAVVEALTMGDNNFFATRVAHTLNLHGPALTVQTACSSSLVAVHLACQSLLLGECDMALAGGMTVKVPHRVGYVHDIDSMMSADGRCRPFDAAANGTVFGSGGGAVVLKRLSDAVADKDNVRAVIRGSATNNDGSLKMGFAAPSVRMQSAVVAEALAVAGFEPQDIGYVEAHGTGTTLGDPVEMAALRTALPTAEDCVVSSVKGNIGHLEAASGIAGLIKAVLALENGWIPGTAHFTEPNRELRLDDSPFVVRADGTGWGERPKIAGVTSLGMGGTNAHVVVAETPRRPERPADQRPSVLVLSARNQNALTDMRQALAAHLRRKPEIPLADVAHSLSVGRHQFEHRFAVMASTAAEAVDLLESGQGLADPQPVPANPDAMRVSLPGYAFQREHHWIEPRATAVVQASPAIPGDHRDVLADLWRETLGVDDVAPNDSFFEQGGDSVMATAFVSRARTQGIDMRPKDLFDNSTFDSLVAHVEARTAPVAQPVEDRRIPLTPTQLWYLSASGHRQTPLLFRLAPDLDRAIVQRAVAAVTARHDALGLVPTMSHGVWYQERRELRRELPLVTADVDSLKTADAVLDLVGETAFVDTVDAVFLAVVVNQVDRASARILTEELITACDHLLAGNAVTLPETTAWARWARYTQDLVNDQSLFAELDHWTATLDVPPDGLSVSNPAGPWQVLRYAAKAEPLTAVRRRAQAKWAELLLTAMTSAWHRLTGRTTMTVDVLGSVRQANPAMSLDRSVGLYSAIYPVTFTAAENRLDAVRQSWRDVPRHGLGYGVLRHLYGPTAERFRDLPEPSVLFAAQGAVGRPVRASRQPLSRMALDVAPTGRHPVEVRCHTADGAFVVEWWHDPDRCDTALLAAWNDQTAVVLDALASP
ncbi:polyketide synthase [Kutzneria buriramensis]|uniref:Condensation domain-containing protein n=1 Tax=Kutzneria buriramensis TaxID=1045776 RepID=A0A3E0GVW6_9PSEU|nr:polyketide synthase [Kutzneria buriramensis]REH27643.1 condensation domain-containing protein [Kutzneria buriramensis]